MVAVVHIVVVVVVADVVVVDSEMWVCRMGFGEMGFAWVVVYSYCCSCAERVGCVDQGWKYVS